MSIEVPFFCKFKCVVSHRFIITFLISIHLPLMFLNGGGGDNYFQKSRKNGMITESVGGMNVNKLFWKGSDNQIRSVSFSGREVH